MPSAHGLPPKSIRKTYAFIFARGGSKGVLRKNVRSFGGKPLIAHTIELARRMPRITKIIVSTDDREIAAVARQYGAQVPFMRPPELAGDNSPEWLAWQQAVRFVRDEMNEPFDCFISLPATSPLRSIDDVSTCFERYDEGTSDMVIGITPSTNSPYFNMLKLDADGRASLVIPPEGKISRRQDAPEVFDIAPCAYITSPDFVLTRSGIFDGVLKTAVIPPERAVDIDTMLDFEFAEFLFYKQAKARLTPEARH